MSYMEHPFMATFVLMLPNANSEEKQQWSTKPRAHRFGTSSVKAFKVLTRLSL